MNNHMVRVPDVMGVTFGPGTDPDEDSCYERREKGGYRSVTSVNAYATTR
jgi:hypothetical protein